MVEEGAKAREVDQIRERAFELGYSMPDIDELARSKRYFQVAGWHNGYINHRAVARAIAALDGDVAASWRPEGIGRGELPPGLSVLWPWATAGTSP